MQLLLRFFSPHKEISSSSNSKWIKDTLVFSGVNTFRNFCGHPNRSVVTSKADLLDFLNIFFVGFLCQMNLHDKIFL